MTERKILMLNFSFEEGIVASVIFGLFLIVGFLYAVSNDNDRRF